MDMVLCGLGGQGILFMTRVLAEAALGLGLKVLGAETHGMAQRGGSVVSHLRLGDVKGSLVKGGSADAVLALEESEGYRNVGFLREGGGLYVNARGEGFPREAVKGYLEGRGVRYHGVEAGRMALELEAPLSTNLALLGFYSAFGQGPLGHDDLRSTVERISRERFREINLRVFDAGYQKANADLKRDPHSRSNSISHFIWLNGNGK